MYMNWNLCMLRVKKLVNYLFLILQNALKNEYIPIILPTHFLICTSKTFISFLWKISFIYLFIFLGNVIWNLVQVNYSTLQKETNGKTRNKTTPYNFMVCARWKALRKHFNIWPCFWNKIVTLALTIQIS